MSPAQKNGGALQLGIKDRHGSFHQWINVRAASKETKNY